MNWHRSALASEADRDEAAADVRLAHAEGRLSSEQAFDQLDRIYSAVTDVELSKALQRPDTPQSGRPMNVPWLVYSLATIIGAFVVFALTGRSGALIGGLIAVAGGVLARLGYALAGRGPRGPYVRT
jgi:hypothetical protein